MAGLLLLAIGVATARAVATPNAGGFDAALAGRVFSAALAFASPRVLDPVTPETLALWGLHGISALDPGLSADLVDGRVQLSMAGRVLFARPAPAPGDSAGWGRASAETEAAAAGASAAVRGAGTQALIQGFFDEMFNHLDPYSRYEPPAPAEAERTKLSVDAGAGLGLMLRGHGVVVEDVVPDGPGQMAGVRVGDHVLAVDGRRVHGRLDLARELLSGPEGAELSLRVRGLDGQVRDLPLTLAYVPPETVFSERMGEVLVIRITSFVNNTAERLSEAIEAGLAAKPSPTAVIVDLRGNRGGLLRQAVTSVALLADHGIIASTAGRDPQATHDWRIDGGDLTHGLPVIVLVDGRSASAAEIMAAALADLGRAVVVGSTTLGKGLVQTITRLPDGGELFVTWSRVLAPRGWPIQSLGVMPQVCTGLGPQKMAAALGDLADGRQDMEAALAASRAARPPLSVEKALEIRAACPASEGGDGDMAAAAFLAAHPGAYKAALLPVQ
jgi:carboxyl-terminal processing protease